MLWIGGRLSGAMARGRVLQSVAAAWVLSLGFDFLVHAGLLARLYARPSPFLLKPREAFRRIPLGYLAFLCFTMALYWLFRRLGVRGIRSGLAAGLAVGGVVWGTFAVGLYSISTIPLPLLAGWWLGQAIELGLASAVLGACLAGAKMKKVWWSVAGAVIVCLVTTVALQSLGLAPSVKLSG
jgi:hypothetical protein